MAQLGAARNPTGRKTMNHHDYPTGDTCLATGQTYAELDRFNIGTDTGQDWQPFISESEYRWWMRLEDRPIPTAC